MEESRTFLMQCLNKGYISKDTAAAMAGHVEKGTFWEGDNLDFLASLVRIGFITSSEAETVKDQPTALPAAKNLLIACYVTHARQVRSSAIITDDLLVRLRAAFENNRNKVAIPDGDLTVSDFCDIMERNEPLKSSLTDAITEALVENVSAFVCVKRRRIRAEVKKLLLACMCYQLARGPQQDETTGEEYHAAPYLLERIERAGFRPDAHDLNATDREALSQAADEYLNILELCYINGEGEKRLEAFDKVATGGIYWFADELDEVVVDYDNVFDCISVLFPMALNNHTATRDDLNFMDFARVLCSVEMCDTKVVESLRGTKYEEYLQALETADTLREVLPADVFEIFQSAADNRQAPTNKTK